MAAATSADLTDEGDDLARGLAGSALLGRQPPAHPFTYNTSFGTLRNRQSWDQTFDLYLRLHGLAFANRTTVSILQDPDVKRNTRNRQAQFELGYVMPQGLTTGLRVAVTRNSDIIGIRQQNSIVRDGDEVSGFGRFERKLMGLPIYANLAYGSVKDRQPEYNRQGRQLGLDANTSGLLLRKINWNLSGALQNDRMNSVAPAGAASDFTSNDHTTDRTASGTLSYAPWRWLTLDAKGSLRRGVLERPDKLETFDALNNPIETIVQERVRTNTNSSDVGASLVAPLGLHLTFRGSVNDTQIRYAADSTRNNIGVGRTFTVAASDTLLGTPLTINFQNGTTRNDYTQRSDGYLQEQWQRRADITTTRRLNRRTNTSLRGMVSLDSRRYSDFRPSSEFSLPPSDQDLLRANGSLRADYTPMELFNTGIEGQIDLTRTINLRSTASINNTDQVGYQVTWRWGFNPWSCWSVSQSNSAGAQTVDYTFAPDRDQLAFVYQIRTGSSLRLTPDWNLEMSYGLNYQSRGTYLQQESGKRAFGKSSGTDQYDLLLRTTYKFFSWLSLELAEQRFVTETFSLPEGARHLDAVTYRRTLNGGLNASYTFRNGATLTGALRRNQTWDEARYNTVPIQPATHHGDNYWQASTTFRTDLDL